MWGGAGRGKCAQSRGCREALCSGGPHKGWAAVAATRENIECRVGQWGWMVKRGGRRAEGMPGRRSVNGWRQACWGGAALQSGGRKSAGRSEGCSAQANNSKVECQKKGECVSACSARSSFRGARTRQKSAVGWSLRVGVGLQLAPTQAQRAVCQGSIGRARGGPAWRRLGLAAAARLLRRLPPPAADGEGSEELQVRWIEQLAGK